MLDDMHSFDQLLREAKTALILVTSDGRVDDINQHALDLLGGQREDYLGTRALLLVDPADWHFLMRKLEDAGPEQAHRLHVTVRLRRKQGRSEWHTISEEQAAPANDHHLVRLEPMQFVSAERPGQAGAG